MDGIIAIGHRGGAGVRGVGNQPEGPRGERRGSGNGGDGVVGQGGSGDLVMAVGDPAEPGRGVLGIGGFWTGPVVGKDRDEPRDNNGGAGVVGVAGGESGPPWVPPFDQTKGVGVYGLSAQGTGVVAKGEQLGLRAIATKGVGVSASGPFGAWADGEQCGIDAMGDGGPGGVFRQKFNPEIGGLPQIGIVPHPMVMPDEVETNVVNVLPADQIDQLPKQAWAGELLGSGLTA